MPASAQNAPRLAVVVVLPAPPFVEMTEVAIMFSASNVGSLEAAAVVVLASS